MSHNRHKIKKETSKELLKAFTPRVNLEPSHSLISDHMKAHYKRIASVQAKIDSHPPISMVKSIKAKEYQTASSTKNVPHNSLISDKSLDVDEDVDHDNQLDSSGRNLTSSRPEEKWRHYVTKTGRLTGYLIKTRSSTSPTKNERKEVWKPAFSLNTTGSLNTNYPSLNQSAAHEINSNGLNSNAKIMNDGGDDGTTLESVKEEGYNTYDGLAVSPTSKCSPLHKCVTDIDSERKMLQRQEELEYLGFISGITQDILSRRCLSDAALELLIGCHIERNLHKLDKDKMMERVAELKEQLGFTT